MPLEAWRPLEHWLLEAERRLRRAKCDGRPVSKVERPDSALVLEALRAGALPCIDAASVRLTDGGAAVEFAINKPDGGGSSNRDLDVEGAAFSVLLFFSGGWLFLNKNGRKGQFFCGRLSIYASGEKAQPYVSRTIANTAPGTQTREGVGEKFRSWRRREWMYRPLREGDTGGKHGRVGAIEQAKAAFAKAFQRQGSQLPEGLPPERFAELLEVAQEMLDRLPLRGQPS